MRTRPGKRPGTTDLVFDQFTGITRIGSESKAAGMTLFVRNGEIALAGGLRVRPQDATETLLDPATGSNLDETIVALITQEKATARQQILLATQNRLFRCSPGHHPNLKEIFLTVDGELTTTQAFPNGIKYVSTAHYYGRTYIATGTHHLLRWDGQKLEDMTEDWSEDWDDYETNYKNYYFPGCVCEHRGHLVLSGFADLKDSRAASQIRIAGSEFDITDTTRLMNFDEEVRTEDPEKVLAMASTGYGLYLFKKNSIHVMPGSDFVNFTDVSKFQISQTHGLCGPMAFCHGKLGIHFMDSFGCHVISNNNPTAVIPTSEPVSEIWSSRARGSNWFLPMASRGLLDRATMAYDREREQVFICFKMTGIST